MRLDAAGWVLLSMVTGCYANDDILPPAPTGATVATCPMPTLDRLYPFATPPPTTTASPEAPSCARGRHDAIIILGCPSDDSGRPSSCQHERVDMAMELSAEGYGDRFIVSGGAVYNDFVEAAALSDLLVAAGVDPGQIVLEPQAAHTDENIDYSTDLMQAAGWVTALVVSTRAHLLYAAACDANCCVRRGRLSNLSFPVASGWLDAGHYVLTPPADEVTPGECDHLRNPTKLMCVNYASRRRCAGP